MPQNASYPYIRKPKGKGREDGQFTHSLKRMYAYNVPIDRYFIHELNDIVCVM